MRTLWPVLACLGGSLLSSSPLFAGATESSRARTTVTVQRNVITADHRVKYIDYALGEWFPVTIEYPAACNIVFKRLALRHPVPFIPAGVVTGEIDNVAGTPAAGRPAKTGAVTFDLRFTALNKSASGGQTGVGRVDLVFLVDKDCEPATGDADGPVGHLPRGDRGLHGKRRRLTRAPSPTLTRSGPITRAREMI